MFKIQLAIYVVWLMAVIIFQFSDTFRQRLGRLPFYLCGLLPSWQMFGPSPVDGDYCLYFRIASAPGGSYGEWQPAVYDRKPPVLTALFFNPYTHISIALREICQQVGSARLERNVYYQLLLNDVIRQSEVFEPAVRTGSRLIQFQICWKTPAAHTSLFCSHAHPF